MNLNVQINRYYFDADYVVIDKSTLPANLKKKMPFFLFGKYDFDCNYRNAVVYAPAENWNYIGVYNRVSMQFLFTGINDIQNFVKNGDCVLIYADNVQAPTYWCAVVMSTPNFGLTGIIQNTRFQSDSIQLFSDNPYQDYFRDWQIIGVSKMGTKTFSDEIVVSTGFTPQTMPNNKKLNIEVRSVINEQTSLLGYVDFDTNEYYMDFMGIQEF